MKRTCCFVASRRIEMIFSNMELHAPLEEKKYDRMNISCIAVEDEPPALEKLVRFIRDTSWLELRATFAKSMDAMAYLHENEVNLMFLDIRMPTMTGLQMLDTLQRKPQVIITTAYTEYALKGYEYGIVDYLLKPYSFERFLSGRAEGQNGCSTERGDLFQCFHLCKDRLPDCQG